MKYNVTFIRNNVFQSNLADAESPLAVMAWYKMYKPDARILDVNPASSDDEKPGKPCIIVHKNYLPFMNAAENMSSILERENGMRCVFYVMDQRYIDNLAYPQLSADNRGNRLIVGD